MPSRQTQRKRQRKTKLRQIQAAAACELVAITAEATVEAAVEAAEGQPAKLPAVTIAAYNGGAMRVPGYYRPVVLDVRGIEGTGRPIPLLRSHDAERIVGQGVAAVEGNNSITVKGTLSAESADVQQITTLARNGFAWQASVGVMPTRIEHVDAGATARVNGSAVDGPAVIVRAGKLREVSFVAMGADDTTQATVAAQAEQTGDAMKFAQWLEAKGFDPAELSDGQKETLRRSYESERAGSSAGSTFSAAGGDGESLAGGTSTNALINERRRREQRSEQYGNILARYMDSGAIRAEEAEGYLRVAESTQMEPRDLELQVLRDSRGGSTQSHQASRSETSEQVIEAALARQSGAYDITAAYPERVLEQVDKHYPRGLTLMEVFAMAARRNGYRSDSYRINESMMRAAFAPVEARGASTYDLSGVLSNVANKAIIAGFNSVESAWRTIAKRSSVTDFKTVTRYALTGDFVYEQVGPSGELKHATMGEESYTNKANVYGRIFAISYEDLVNDDLSAFDRVRQMLGRGGALKINKVFWTEFLADIATFYTTGRGNYFTGAATVLQSSSLQTAEQMLMEQTDPDGNPLAGMGKYLLTPPAISVTAQELYVSTNINTGGSSTKDKVPDRNVFAGRYQPVSSVYLGTAGGLTNASDTHWFLLQDPMDRAVIELVFLNGREEPIVEAAQADFDQMGVQMRGYHNFGAAKQEYRAAVRSKGAA